MINLKTACAALLALLLAAVPLAAQQEPASQPDSQDRQASQDDQGDSGPGQEPAEQGPNIYPTLAKSLIDRGAPVIDVRSDEEVAETGVLADAAHIPHTEIDEIAEFIGEDTNRAVVLYCGSGRRAARAIEALRERGYTGLVNAGGYDDLRAAIEGEGDDEG